MYITIHATSALLIPALTSHPFLSFCSAIILHFVLDSVPHDPKGLEEWSKNEQNFFAVVFADFALMFLTLFLINLARPLPLNINLISALAGAILPDVIFGLSKYSHSKMITVFQRFHNNFVHGFFYKKQLVPWYVTVLVQTIVLALFIFLFLIAS